MDGDMEEDMEGVMEGDMKRVMEGDMWGVHTMPQLDGGFFFVTKT